MMPDQAFDLLDETFDSLFFIILAVSIIGLTIADFVLSRYLKKTSDSKAFLTR